MNSQDFQTGSLERFSLAFRHTPEVFACQDLRSLRFVPIYHDAKSCEKSGYKMDREGDFPTQRERSSPHCCCDDNSMQFVPLYATARHQAPPSSVSSDGFASSVTPCQSLSKFSQPKFFQLIARGNDVSVHRERSLHHCSTSEGSMGFIPLYGVARPLSPPRRVSESCDGFATSTPSHSVSSSSQRKFFEKTRLEGVNSSDSGIVIDSASVVISSSDALETDSSGACSRKNCELKKRVVILKRYQSDFKTPNTPTKRQDAKRLVQKNLSSMFEKLTIPNGTDASSDSSSFEPAKLDEERPKDFLRPTEFRRSTSKLSARPKASKTRKNSSCCATSLSGRSLWGKNNNKAVDSIPASKRNTTIPLIMKPCTFCLSNNETGRFVSSHSLKQWDHISNRYKLTCPVLRRYECPRCGATGDSAHTYTYCPETIKEVGRRPESLISKLKSTAHNSSGKKRM